LKESPEDRAYRKEILQSVRREGAATLELAPLLKVPRGLPPTWQQALTDPKPESAVLDKVWRPLAKQYPKTIAAMRRTLRRVGLLTTKKRSHSLVYLFELEGDGGLWFRRGYLPAPKLPKLASRLPKEFLAIYPVHDGWLDGHEMMGPRRSKEWSPLGRTGPSRDFLVTFEGHGPAILGFDLSEKPAPCYTVWTQSDPQRVRKVAREMDEWIGGRMDEYQLSTATRPKPAPKKKQTTTKTKKKKKKKKKR
jgi:hypothetical protein